MKKTFISSALALAVLSSPFAAVNLYASSCDGCASRKVCSEAKAGGSCSDSSTSCSAASQTPVQVSTVKTEFSSLSASMRPAARTVIVKIKGDKALLNKLSTEISTRFGLKDNKSADCELVSIASELWIKMPAGKGKEKVEYLESLGLKVEKLKK